MNYEQVRWMKDTGHGFIFLPKWVACGAVEKCARTREKQKL